MSCTEWADLDSQEGSFSIIRIRNLPLSRAVIDDQGDLASGYFDGADGILDGRIGTDAAFLPLFRRLYLSYPRFIGRAGTPATRSPDATLRWTTAPAPTKAPAPIWIP